jgi:arginyl-tRNA synthetase
MDIVNQLRDAVQKILKDHYQAEVPLEGILVSETKPEFEGDYTVVLFSFVKQIKKSPEVLGLALGQALQNSVPNLVQEFNVIRGFLNLRLVDKALSDFLRREFSNRQFGSKPGSGKKIILEYSSPNTNKPLHLGHLRNNFLGWSVASIYKMNGYDTVKTCIANDRGIHICKSMVAWQMFAHGATPESTGIKGDHFVGDYYVMFGEELKKQSSELRKNGLSAEEADREAPLMKEAQQMLLDWESGKPEVIALWNKMNAWVYKGFDETYHKIGSDFDKIYYESQTYLLGKDLVESGLEKEVFFMKEDGSIWIDLTADGLDQKIVQRKDGTAVYMTQDIGLVVKKYEDFHCETSIYVVADEQNYHFKVLKLISQKLGLPSADGLFHLSYGLVELPSGRMKTREGTVVDADDIVEEMIDVARKHTIELGKVQDFTEAELKDLYETIGLGALKFYLVRVDPKKKIVFNPEESIDFHGFTGPFVQYTYARIKSILRKEENKIELSVSRNSDHLGEQLIQLGPTVLLNLDQYPARIGDACE